MAKTAAEVEEDRRLFYVALTRARDLLTVSWAAARTPGARGSRKPSRFLDGVLEQPDARGRRPGSAKARSEEHTSEVQSRGHLVCRLLLGKKKGIGRDKANRRDPN